MPKTNASKLKKLEQVKKAAEAIAVLEGTTSYLEVKTSEQGRIYGSVGAAHVADKL